MGQPRYLSGEYLLLRLVYAVRASYTREDANSSASRDAGNDGIAVEDGVFNTAVNEDGSDCSLLPVVAVSTISGCVSCELPPANPGGGSMPNNSMTASGVDPVVGNTGVGIAKVGDTGVGATEVGDQ